MCATKTRLKSGIVDNLDEEYYQISPDILESFPKFRPPLNLYRLKEDTAQILLYKKQDERMDKETQEEVAQTCAEGNLFVARTDHPIYSKHIAKQLDLVLVDEHLKEAEIAEVFTYAITDRIDEFFEQPVGPVFTKLYNDVMVLTEYLWNDKNRAKALVRRLHKEHTLARHSYNCGVLGLWLFNKVFPGGFNRRVYDKTALAFFLHDMGMSKIPAFIRDKPKALTTDERTKVNLHPLLGSKLALKLGLKFDEMQQAVMEHHERLDGSGYPARAKQISPLGAMAAVVDSYCAMTTTRPYAPAKEPREAVAELNDMKSKYGDKALAPLFKAVVTGDW